MKPLLPLLRTLHLYLSLLGCVLIAFFAVSGFMLNHDEWFGTDEVRSTQVTYGSIPAEVLPAPTGQEDKLPAEVERRLEDAIRQQFHLRGTMKEPVIGSDRIDLIFESPGRTVTASVDLAKVEANSGSARKVTVRSESTGLIGRLCELHKKSTKNGVLWRRMVDGTAILLLITSLTGLVMWVGTFKRRGMAAVALLGGAAVFAVAYLVLVP